MCIYFLLFFSDGFIPFVIFYSVLYAVCHSTIITATLIFHLN